jgi:hypothetical protein
MKWFLTTMTCRSRATARCRSWLRFSFSMCVSLSLSFQLTLVAHTQISGSTRKPKGVVHTRGGYLLCAALSVKYLFDVHPDDCFACMADVGRLRGIRTFSPPLPPLLPPFPFPPSSPHFPEINKAHAFFSYITHGPLNGVSTFMFESTPRLRPACALLRDCGEASFIARRRR